MQQEAPGGDPVSAPLADFVQEDPGEVLVPVQVFPCQSRPGGSQQAQEALGKVPVPIQVVPLADLAQEATGKKLVPVQVVSLADLAQEAPGKVLVPVQVIPFAELAQEAPGKVPRPVQVVPLADLAQEDPGKIPVSVVPLPISSRRPLALVPAQVVLCYKPAINRHGQEFCCHLRPSSSSRPCPSFPVLGALTCTRRSELLHTGDRSINCLSESNKFKKLSLPTCPTTTSEAETRASVEICICYASEQCK
jgi:hypothetical protein